MDAVALLYLMHFLVQDLAIVSNLTSLDLKLMTRAAISLLPSSTGNKQSDCRAIRKTQVFTPEQRYIAKLDLYPKAGRRK